MTVPDQKITRHIELKFPEGINEASFLHLVWQKRPLLFRQAFAEMPFTITPEELAGLACEPDVESRIVMEKSSPPWQLHHGPFDEESFADLPESHWTLLVQDVDKHWPEVAELLDAFKFIPSWRIDDIMLSYATDQGSVGPHTDEYDVFLIQLAGKRRWQINRHADPGNSLADTSLRILSDFSAEDDWLLEPGDMLYLPPGVAHWGVAQDDDCITCSVGFRAPSHQEMLSHWADEFINMTDSRDHYRDPRLDVQKNPSEITPAVIAASRKTIENYLSFETSDYARWFGKMMTETKEHLEIEPMDEPMSPDECLQAFMADSILYRHPYARLAFTKVDDSDYLVFVNGECIESRANHHVIEVVTQQKTLHFGYMKEDLENHDDLELVTDLVNRGVFYFDEDND